MLSERLREMRYSVVRHGHGTRSALDQMQLALNNLILEGDRDDWDLPISPSNRHLLGYHPDTSRYQAYVDADDFAGYARWVTEDPAGMMMRRSNGSRTTGSRVGNGVPSFQYVGLEGRYSDESSETDIAMARALNDNHRPTATSARRPIILGETLSDSSEDLETPTRGSVLIRKTARPAASRGSGETEKPHTCECCKGIVPKPKSNTEKEKDSGAKAENEDVPSTFRWVHIEIV